MLAGPRPLMCLFLTTRLPGESRPVFTWLPLFGSQTLVPKLLARGDSINARDGRGRAPLQMAALAEQKDVSRILLAGPDVDADLKDEDGFTPLRVATCCRATEIVQQLTVRADVDVKTVDTVYIPCWLSSCLLSPRSDGFPSIPSLLSLKPSC